MGKMYTLQPDESINDHVKDTRDIINHIVELSIGCMRDLANPHEGTFIDMTYNKFMRSLEHIRESIEMLDELCDELEDDKDKIRHEYEKKVIQFFNRFMNADLTDETNYRLGECVRHIHEIENHYMSEIQQLNEDLEHFCELAISRNKELEEERERSNQLEKRLKGEHEKYMKLREAKEESPAYWKAQFERMQEKSNQLEKRCHDLIEDRDGVIEFWEGKFQKAKTQFELAKKFLHMRRDEVSRLKEELRQTQLVKDAQKKVIDEKENALLRLNHEIWELQEQAEYWEDLAKKIADQNGCDITSCYPKINNPANFCGNCKYFKIHPNDVGMCENIYGRYSKTVDPDDASCQAFESNNPTVVIGKPEFPCCDHCNHEDCDDCTLCPF